MLIEAVEATGARPVRHRMVILSVLLIAALTLAATVVARQTLLPALDETARGRLSWVGASLDAAVGRFAYLPELLGRTAEIRALFAPGAAPSSVDAANRALEVTARSAGADALFVLDATGTTLAASNWREETSFVGRSYDFRPYFRAAINGEQGRYYAVGVTTGVAGYFLSAPVWAKGQVVGVVVVKINLAPLETEWTRSGERIAVVADDGVVLLASLPAWRYRQLLPAAAASGGIPAEQRYADIEIAAEPILDTPPRPSVVQSVRLDGSRAAEALVVVSDLPHFGWRVLYAADVTDVDRQVVQTGLATALAGALFAALAAVGVQRRRARLAEREALVLLDRRVRERTAELADANHRLEAEILERGKAEADLHRTRDQLVQSAKLAALGQTLAGFAHELNQPLAALRTYLASARLLIAKGRTGEAEQTVGEMADTIDRLRDLNDRVKSLARRDDGTGGPIDLVPIVERTLRLMTFRFRDAEIAVETALPAALPTTGSDSRMEQVVLNLLSNAIDAVGDSADRRVRVEGRQSGGYAVLEVHDSGCGLDAEAAERLFEPFFTTKQAGKGLGLGLAISHRIALDYGGTLEARCSPLGGAVFALSLPVRRMMPARLPEAAVDGVS
ncbi:ATP-binding protein [Mongoliimonas terrestris]|uniref:ATP-binding protein n=1 Tax=Mongoliimonas terrestris TaxID=1709001 RepID=UPI000A87080B|nr:ATP-binding protein [Mongoliimonas terrestris]